MAPKSNLKPRGSKKTALKGIWKDVPDERHDDRGTWVTTRRACKLFRISQSALHGWCENGHALLPGFRLSFIDEPLGPGGREIRFFLVQDLQKITDAINAPATKDAVSIEEFAERFGIKRQTVYHWFDAVPFPNAGKLVSVRRVVIGPDGRPFHRRLIPLREVERIEKLTPRPASKTIPAHEAESRLSVSRNTVDNLRNRGELTGIWGTYMRGTLPREGWLYYEDEVARLAAKKSEPATGSKDWRHVDSAGRRWLLETQARELYGVSKRRFGEAAKAGRIRHQRIPNPRRNGRFKIVKVYFEDDVRAVASGALPADNSSAPTPEKAVGAKELKAPRQAMLSGREFADYIGQPVDRVEKFLTRFRESNPDCCNEVENPRRNEPRFLYRVADVWPQILLQLSRWNAPKQTKA